MSATVNGGSWVANECLATRTTEGVTIEGTLHMSSGDYSNIAIYLPKGYSTGTYYLANSNTDDVHASYMPHSYTNSMLFAVNGNVTISSVNSYITGTFIFITSDSTRIESGSFSIKAP
ncbi:MAG: hypothetical protein JSS82_16385 [Bacteroidetes bacterium]|nr:hypothetical protein [Bacteroidota bacterium]